MAASWEIDVAPAADILARLAPRAPGADTSERDELLHGLVNAARIVEVNDRTASLVRGNRGRALIAGQSVAAFWPLESRTILLNLILEARADRQGRSVPRSLAHDGLLRDTHATEWHADDDRPATSHLAV